MRDSDGHFSNIDDNVRGRKVKGEKVLDFSPYLPVWNVVLDATTNPNLTETYHLLGSNLHRLSGRCDSRSSSLVKTSLDLEVQCNAFNPF